MSYAFLNNQLDFYSTVADGAGPHNSIYRGKWLGNEVSEAQYTAIQNGTFRDLFIGDYWTIGNYVYRIASFNYYYGCGDTQFLLNHVVIVPDEGFYSAAMDDTGSTDGAYVGSTMYTTNLASAKQTISEAFGEHVLSHRIYLSNTASSGKVTAGAWYDSTVELLSEQMAFGSTIRAQLGGGTYQEWKVEKSQLPLFFFRHDLFIKEKNWWLRDPVSGSNYAYVNDNGCIKYGATTSTFRVVPYFCIGVNE